MKLLRRLARAGYRELMARVARALPRDPSRRDVLFLCHNGLMAEHLAPVWDCVKDDPRLRCAVTYPVEPDTAHEIPRIRELMPADVVKLRWAYVRPWDLIVTADHGHAELADRARAPTIFTGHGVAGKVVAGEAYDYRYGPRAFGAGGAPRYTSMLEASDHQRARVLRDRPELAGVIEVVGSLQDDVLLAAQARRDEVRAELGYGPGDRVVLVLGSWGPDSLFHTIGDGLLAAAHGLTSEYRFIFSVHPHEYRPRPAGERVWGEHLRGLEAEGFRVRDPAASWVPHLVASDVLVTDHTSLAVKGALIGRPAVFAPVPDRCLRQGTLLWQLRALCRVLDAPSRLGEELGRALGEFPRDALAELAGRINSRPGESRPLVRRALLRAVGLSDPDGGAAARSPDAGVRQTAGLAGERL